MERDIETLAHLVRTSYLPSFREDIDKCEDQNIKSLLEQRYKEVETICNDYLEDEALLCVEEGCGTLQTIEGEYCDKHHKTGETNTCYICGFVGLLNEDKEEPHDCEK